MLIAIASNPKDFERCLEWFDWAHELQSSYERHWCLVIGSLTLDEASISLLGKRAKACGFRQVVAIRAKEEPDVGWPVAANLMWKMAAEYAKDHARCSFLWCESDAIPLSEGWVDKIEAEHVANRKPFTGTLYPHPYKHMNGIGVYPENVRKFNPLIFNSEFVNMPFDTVRPDATLRHAHITPLIWRGLEDPETNTPHTFPDFESLSIIPQGCVLAHCCKDGSLIARLREAKNPAFVPPPKPTLIEKIVNGAKRLITGENTYYHSGNLGDVAYSLPAIKACGGGDLIIGPEQRKTAPCAVPIDKKQFEMFLPLLKAQPYLKNISYSPKYPQGARDLNHFRSIWNNAPIKQKKGIKTLCQCHFEELGILREYDETATWLTCPQPIKTGKIVVHRSPRYQSPPAGPQSFPWQRIVDEHHEEMVFVGLESEYDAFVKMFKHKLSFWKVKDFMELASVIAGGRCFVGNQSFPLSVALGLGQNVICESLPRSPDTRFNRENYSDQLIEPDYAKLTALLT